MSRSPLPRLLVLLLITFPALADAPGEPPQLLIWVERQTTEDLEVLLEAGLVVVQEARSGLFLLGASGEPARLESLGRAVTVLDEALPDRAYLLVGTRPGVDVPALLPKGELLLERENWLLFRVPGETALTDVSAHGLFVSALPRETMRRPRHGARPSSALAGRLSSGADPLVQKIVDAVETTRIDQYWQELTANPPTGTRYTSHQGCRDAAGYCYDALDALGFDVEYHDWNSNHAPNVIATRQGALRPDDVYIVLGHLDDMPQYGLAPGADDNASGVVNVLENAAAMSCLAYKSTVKFIAVTGEEVGLLGSTAYAQRAEQQGENILAVINMDMPGWEGDGTPNPEDLDLNYNSASQWLGEQFAANASEYGTGVAVDAFYCPSLTASDHWPFWQRGWSAVAGITDNQGYCGHGGYYPHYHTADDTIANCGDPSFFYGVVRTSAATLAELAEPFKVTFAQDSLACGGDAEVLVGDRDLDADPGLQETVAVSVWSDSEPTPEILTLIERDSSDMIFSGSIPTTLDGPAAGDGLLTVSPGDTIHAAYTDAVDCDGSTGVPYAAAATMDCAVPSIWGVGESGVTDTQAAVLWSTDEDATSLVRWSGSLPPLTEAGQPGLQQSHRVDLAGLQECTVYYYEVESEDAAGNVAVDDNGGQYHRFETLGDFGQGLQPCRAGRITFDLPGYRCSGSVGVSLVDLDLNLDSQAVDSVVVAVTSSTETTPEPMLLTETGPNTSLFVGAIPISVDAPAPDGLLQGADGDVVTVTYLDADDGTGLPAASYATTALDCSAPEIRRLRVEQVTDQRLTVRFDTLQPGTTVVEWGPTPALGESIVEPALTTSHETTISRLDLCQPFYLRVSSADGLGNASIADLGGSPFAVHTWDIPGLYWRETFEGGGAGWSLEGEWQVGAPQGLGGDYGAADPLGAYNNFRALGNDLSGLGAYPGDYEHSTTEAAESPGLSASDWTNTRLLLYCQLNVRHHDEAALEIVKRNKATELFNNGGSIVTQYGYSQLAFDVSGIVDRARDVSLRFRLVSDPQNPFSDDGISSGWNVDDVIFKDGSLPDYAACGGCGLAPSFKGARSATDLDACGGGGVLVSWDEAVAWGTGDSGSYAVYRDTSPGFEPGPGNLLASGVTALSYNDPAPPTDVDLHYLVLAENSETCSTGPANGGLIDTNRNHVGVRDSASVADPEEVGNLGLVWINHAHVGLQWDPEALSSSYRVYRSELPQPGGYALLGETTEVGYEDLDQAGDGNSYYYLVKGVNACGSEGP